MNFVEEYIHCLGGRRECKLRYSIYVEDDVYLFVVNILDAYYSHDSDTFAVVVVLTF